MLINSIKQCLISPTTGKLDLFNLTIVLSILLAGSMAVICTGIDVAMTWHGKNWSNYKVVMDWCSNVGAGSVFGKAAQAITEHINNSWANTPRFEPLPDDKKQEPKPTEGVPS